MQKHLTQANHNQDFYSSICSSYSDHFFDWKITALFYTALHWLRAYAAKKNVDIGNSHEQVERNCNPKSNRARLRLSSTAWKNYRKLQNDSHTARYEGFINFEDFQKLKELDHQYCVKAYNDFSKYLEDRGVKVNNRLLQDSK